MPAAATITPVRSSEFSSSTSSRRELEISSTPNTSRSSPESGTAWKLSPPAPEPTMPAASRRSNRTCSISGRKRAGPAAGPLASINSDGSKPASRLR